MFSFRINFSVHWPLVFRFFSFYTFLLFSSQKCRITVSMSTKNRLLTNNCILWPFKRVCSTNNNAPGCAVCTVRNALKSDARKHLISSAHFNCAISFFKVKMEEKKTSLYAIEHANDSVVALVIVHINTSSTCCHGDNSWTLKPTKFHNGLPATICNFLKVFALTDWPYSWLRELHLFATL